METLMPVPVDDLPPKGIQIDIKKLKRDLKERGLTMMDPDQLRVLSYAGRAMDVDGMAHLGRGFAGLSFSLTQKLLDEADKAYQESTEEASRQKWMTLRIELTRHVAKLAEILINQIPNLSLHLHNQQPPAQTFAIGKACEPDKAQ